MPVKDGITIGCERRFTFSVSETGKSVDKSFPKSVSEQREAQKRVCSGNDWARNSFGLAPH